MNATMNPELHIRIAGALQLALAIAHIPFPRWFKWREDLAKLSLLNRNIFIVHDTFIVLMLILFGILSVFAPSALLEPARMALYACIALTIFWLLRLYAQWFIYSPHLWRGHRGRTAIHFSITLLWIYLTAAYAAALVQHAR